jgi:CheY-like chemotaxis protein
MGKRILIVDDSGTTRAVIKVHLTGRSLEFTEAQNAEQGLKMTSGVQLVIADINMPGGMDGLEFVRKLRAHADQAIRKLPIILLTGDKSEELREKGLKAGANAFVHKPVSSARLVEVVDKLLN